MAALTQLMRQLDEAAQQAQQYRSQAIKLAVGPVLTGPALLMSRVADEWDRREADLAQRVLERVGE